MDQRAIDTCRVLFKIPTRGRPAVFEDTMSGWVGKATGPVDFLVSLDSDDPALNAALDTCTRLGLRSVVGRSKSKVDAINRDVKSWSEPWDVVVVGSDDMKCEAAGWDRHIATDMLTNFPDLAGCIHYPDGNRRDLMTFTVMGRPIYNGLGYLYHPDYKSLWCDNDLHDMLKSLGRLAFVDRQLVRHAHFTVANGIPKDQLYVRNEALFKRDKAVYQRRRDAGFDSAALAAALS